MASVVNKIKNSEFRFLFNFNDEFAVGRSSLFIHSIIITITNAIITGGMYTAFLTLNGIDIVNVSIITFIPYIAWAFSIFTPMIYSRVKRRRGLLIFNTTFYYSCIILATTIMPRFVAGTSARTMWFAGLLLVGNISNALLGSGATAWHIHYISEERSRTGYFAYANIVNTAVSTTVAISAALAADALAGSPQQAMIINAMRYAAYLLALISTLYLWLRPKIEYPYPIPDKKLRLLDVVRDPVASRPFRYTALIFFIYNFTANVNAGSWNYYVLNTLEYKLVFMYSINIAYALAYIILLSRWRRAVSKHSYLKVYLFAMAASVLLEIPMALTRSGTVWVYITTSVLQGLNLVGVSYINSNLFYTNLPRGKTDTCIVFWNLGANIFALAGSLAGTLFISFTERTGPYNINFNFLSISLSDYQLYGSQLLVIIKALLYIILCAFVVFSMRRLRIQK